MDTLNLNRRDFLQTQAALVVGASGAVMVGDAAAQAAAPVLVGPPPTALDTWIRIAADGSVLRDVAVFREAYALIGLGWLYAPTAWPLLAPLVNGLYGLWAAARLRLTRRPCLDQLCELRRQGMIAPAAGVSGAGAAETAPDAATAPGAGAVAAAAAGSKP